MEVPPLLSVFAWLTHVLGDGVFWVNWWPTLFGALTFLGGAGHLAPPDHLSQQAFLFCPADRRIDLPAQCPLAICA
jgi:hypothetical protein